MSTITHTGPIPAGLASESMGEGGCGTVPRPFSLSLFYKPVIIVAQNPFQGTRNPRKWVWVMGGVPA